MNGVRVSLSPSPDTAWQDRLHIFDTSPWDRDEYERNYTTEEE